MHTDKRMVSDKHIRISNQCFYVSSTFKNGNQDGITNKKLQVSIPFTKTGHYTLEKDLREVRVNVRVAQRWTKASEKLT